MSHFMMDCYYPDATTADGYRSESFPIKALNEEDAIQEAKRGCNLEEAGSLCPSQGWQKR